MKKLKILVGGLLLVAAAMARAKPIMGTNTWIGQENGAWAPASNWKSVTSAGLEKKSYGHVQQRLLLHL